MSGSPGKLQELLHMLDLIEDRTDRIEMLISMADRFKPVPEAIARPPFPETARVPHCESEVFVFPEKLHDGRLKFHFAVENPQGISAMATAVILDQCLSGQPLEEVARVDPGIVYSIFGRELSTGKGLGLTGMVSMVQHAAARSLTEDGSGE